MKEEIAAILINRSTVCGGWNWKEIMDVFSCPSQILRASKGKLKKVLGKKKAGLIDECRRDQEPGEAEWERLRERGGGLVYWGHPDFPPLLREIPQPPLALYVWGDPAILQREGVALVGARRASGYGRSQARRFSLSLAEIGLNVVSGLARGIDGEAHRGALQGGGITTAVLGGGLAEIYPARHRTLAEKIVDKGGAVITEFPLDAPPKRHHFPWRNRIVSGLCRGVVVVEGGIKSGTLITAQWALEQNREVFAIPGPVDSSNSAGVHHLIQEGAKLVTSPVEVVSEIIPALESQLDLPFDDEEEEREDRTSPGDLTRAERAVLEVVREGKRFLEEIHREVDMPLPQVLGALLRLELARVVRKLPGEMYEIMG